MGRRRDESSEDSDDEHDARRTRKDKEGGRRREASPVCIISCFIMLTMLKLFDPFFVEVSRNVAS
eukprot:5520521-Pleurochrysis_carterae.AAC.2